MEELLLEIIKYIATFLGGMICSVGLDVFVARDKTGDEQRDKEDACNGILRGQAAENFLAQVDEVNKHFYKKEKKRLEGYVYVHSFSPERIGWCIFKGIPKSVTCKFYSGPYMSMEQARDEARRLNKERRAKE